MPKKKVKRKKKSSVSKPKIKDDKGKDRIISILVENTAEMQKAVVGLTEKLNKLANQVNDLLALFEVTARSIAEKPELGFEREFTDKINTLLEQNRIIARGISLMSQQVFSSAGHQMPAPQPIPRPTPRPMMPPQRPTAPPRPTAQAAPKANVSLPPQAPPMPSPSEEYSASEYKSQGMGGEEAKKPKPMPPAPSQK